MGNHTHTAPEVRLSLPLSILVQVQLYTSSPPGHAAPLTALRVSEFAATCGQSIETTCSCGVKIAYLYRMTPARNTIASVRVSALRVHDCYIASGQFCYFRLIIFCVAYNSCVHKTITVNQTEKHKNMQFMFYHDFRTINEHVLVHKPHFAGEV